MNASPEHPADSGATEMAGILIAGIGNMFLGDDGFGSEVARRLASRPMPEGVKVMDAGIRGMDLVYALMENPDLVILVDIAKRGEAPGVLYLIEPDLSQAGPVALDAHGMDPVKVLALAQALGARWKRVLLVGCEPEVVIDAETSEEILAALSPAVEAAAPEAIKMIESLVEKWRPSKNEAAFAAASRI